MHEEDEEDEDDRHHEDDDPLELRHGPGALGPADRLHHHREAEEHRRKVDVPVVEDGKPHRFEAARHDEERGQNRVEDEDPQVEPEELRVERDLLPGAVRFDFRAPGLVLPAASPNGRRRSRFTARIPVMVKEPGDAPEFGEWRRDHKRKGEREPDRGAHQRHRLRDDALAHGVRNEGRDRGGNGARSLERAPEHHDAQMVGGARGDEAPDREDDEPQDDDGLSTPAVRGPAVRGSAECPA